MSDYVQPTRVIVRALADFTARAVRVSARLHGGDLLGAVVFATVQNTNLSFLARNASEAGDLFASLEGLTDEQLRPVSVNAIAKSFSIPYETTRGAAARLIKRGYCVRAPGGLIAPMEVLRLRDNLDVERDISLILADMIDQLGRIGFDFDQIALAGGWRDGVVINPSPMQSRPPPTRLIAWIATDFLLQIVEILAPVFGDFTSAFIFTAVLTFNTRDVASSAEQAWVYASMDAPVPDEARKPIRVRHLAELLDMPFETTRRHLNRMMATGMLARVDEGVIVSAHALAGDQILGAAPLVVLRFTRMIAELKRAGYPFSPKSPDADAARRTKRVG